MTACYTQGMTVRKVLRLTHETAVVGTRVRVADSDSLYRGYVGTVVSQEPMRLTCLDDYRRRLLREGLGVLVETDRGELFVVQASLLERE